MAFATAGCVDSGAKTSCAKCPTSCAADEVCFGDGDVHVGACLKRCTTTTDCPTGQRCYLVTAESGPICSATVPPLCQGATDHCTPTNCPQPTICLDQNRIAIAVDDNGQPATAQTCNFEVKACPNGCVIDVGDGGVDCGPARCK